MKKKVLLFGWKNLPVILAAAAAASAVGAEAVSVQPGSYRRTLGALAEGSVSIAPEDSSEELLQGSMMVLCHLEREADELLAALRTAGVGSGCLKAMLTPVNRDWTPLRLYQELEREHQMILKRQRGTQR